MATEIGLIADPKRLAILELVWDAERTAGDIAGRFDITFGAVSQHLRRLSDAGMVAVRRDGRRRWYRARRETLGPFAEALEAMWRGRLAKLKQLAEAEEQAGGSPPAAKQSEPSSAPDGAGRSIS